MNKKTLIDATGILALALVIVGGYKLSPLLLPKVDLQVQPLPGCDLQRGPCEAALPDGGRITLSVTPRPIPLLKPLQLEVAVSGRTVDKVAVDFAGVDMDMGLNRPELKPAGEGRFSGQGSLPVCVTGGMDWQATVLLDSGREHIAVPFRFASGRG